MHLSIYNSKMDRAGNCYYAFRFTHENRKMVEATCGLMTGAGNIRMAELAMRGRWPETGEQRWFVEEIQLGIREFNRLTKDWQYVGCNEHAMLTLIQRETGLAPIPLTEAEEGRAGEKVAKVMGLKRDTEHADRWQLPGWGSKTNVGLCRTVVEIARRIQNRERIEF